jgi:hypothetical protein
VKIDVCVLIVWALVGRGARSSVPASPMVDARLARVLLKAPASPAEQAGMTVEPPPADWGLLARPSPLIARSLPHAPGATASAPSPVRAAPSSSTGSGAAAGWRRAARAPLAASGRYT